MKKAEDKTVYTVQRKNPFTRISIVFLFLDNDYMGLLSEVVLDKYLYFQNLPSFQFSKHALAISHGSGIKWLAAKLQRAPGCSEPGPGDPGDPGAPEGRGAAWGQECGTGSADPSL